MSQWIAGIARGHNGGICLLKDGEIVFAIEEERLSRAKYDGGPYASMIKVLDYTDKLDFLAIAHTQPDTSACDFAGDTVYAALARKLRLIEGTGNKTYSPANGQIIDMHLMHHKTHAACAFYRSGFETATAVIVDGAGTFIPISVTTPNNTRDVTWEVESIFDCSYPNNFRTLYKHQGGNGPYPSVHYEDIDSAMIPGGQEEGTHELIIDDSPGIVKAYEAVTEYCGWNAIEAGKTMGLFPYGKPNDNIPNIYTTDGGEWRTADKNVIIPTYPNGAMVNSGRYTILQNDGQEFTKGVDLTKLQNRRDMAYAVQTESQQLVLELIRKAVELSGNKNVVLSGGYGLNCVANYWYLEQLKDEDINLYVEPISSDAGTAMGAALLVHYNATGDFTPRKFGESLFLGPEQKNSTEDIVETAKKYNATGVFDGQHIKDAINLILQGNIVALFQGKSESGPRALGNRSILFDPRTLDGKDHVNKVKRREYFRPFAGSILHEHANDWFDMRGMEESPHMMYAVNCKTEDHAKQIPAIIHIDGTCRIQTVKEHQNPLYYEMINEFYKQTNVPILFNTSFNLGGEPLVETIDDAIRALVESDLEYLYIPESELIIEVSNNN
tara:strand:- start:62 stop:1894 length:1833 start_codon:yes stop_codon:yes gene_type:complete